MLRTSIFAAIICLLSSGCWSGSARGLASKKRLDNFQVLVYDYTIAGSAAGCGGARCYARTGTR